MQSLSQQARMTLDAAQAAVRERNQEYVGAEHLFLGLLDCADSQAVEVLTTCGARTSSLREALLRELPEGAQAPGISGDLSLSPQARKAINDAIDAATAGHEANVSTRLILRALSTDQHSTLRSALKTVGADLDSLHTRLAEPSTKAEE